MQDNDPVFLQVKKTLADLFEIDPATILPETKLYDDLDLDSLDAVDMASQLGTDTKMMFTNDDLRSIVTVSDVADAIIAKQREADK